MSISYTQNRLKMVEGAGPGRKYTSKFGGLTLNIENLKSLQFLTLLETKKRGRRPPNRKNCTM